MKNTNTKRGSDVLLGPPGLLFGSAVFVFLAAAFLIPPPL